MFGWFKKQSKRDLEDVRKLLFGDVPLKDWKPRDGQPEDSEPWSSFAAARAALGKSDSAGAIAALQRVAEVSRLESRQYLQAWHALRKLGVQPPVADAKRVRGVVLEVQLRDGLDTLAAYTDHTARYINHGGKLIVWEAQDPEIDQLIDVLMRAGQRIADVIGVWDQPRRSAPPPDHVRINMLTASGLHFGEGPFDELSGDPMGGPTIAAAMRLMKALIARAEASE